MKNLTTLIAPLLIVAAILLGAIPVSAHEFWLLPKNFQPAIGDRLQVEVRNGQKFSGGALGYFKSSVERFEIIQNRTRHPIKARSGDFPALNIQTKEDGLIIVVYQSTRSSLTYADYEIFTTFVNHKKLGNIVERHDERGLPRDGIRETYSRFSKSLVAVGSGKGSDGNTGLLTEIIALANPYTDELPNGLPVKLLYQNKPRIGEQIEIFEKSPRNVVSISTVMTDEKGQAFIPVKPGYIYMLDAEVMREPSPSIAETDNVMWESLWANLTFMVPNK